MWWGIRAVVKAQFAVIAFLLNLSEILSCEFREITLVIIDPVKQRVKRGAQVEAAATTITDIKNP